MKLREIDKTGQYGASCSATSTTGDTQYVGGKRGKKNTIQTLGLHKSTL
jgi:hypothetical protein